MSPARRAGLLSVAAVAAVLTAAAVQWGLPSDPVPEPPEPAAPTRTEAAHDDARPAATIGVHRPAGANLSIESGGILELEAASLPKDAPLVVDLRIPPEAGTKPELAVRVLSGTDGRQLETTGTVGPGGASVAIDPAFLSPGRYLVELSTTERSHMPVRRYVLAVR